MNEIEFNNLIHKDMYQVLLFRCKAHFPFNFADHLWFVVNRKGTISRWEILHSKNRRETDFGYLYKNFRPPFKGINVFNFSNIYTWKSELLYMIEGDENSIAKKMADFTEDSPKNYPYKDIYSLRGPHCATYVQWILNQFPEFNFKLKNYIGKDYKK